VHQLLNGDYLFSLPPGDPNSWYIVLPIGFGILLLASLFLYYRRTTLAPVNPVLRRIFRRMAQSGMWIAGMGLGLALARYVQFDYLDLPIWMLVLVLGSIVSVGYYVYEFSERYPLAMWKLEESQVARRYHAAPKRRGETQPVKPRVRGKQRRRSAR
jgi:hypothetical protein